MCHVTIHTAAVECLTTRSHKSNILLDAAKHSQGISHGGAGAWDRHQIIIDRVVVTGV
jgi:hypothetical protein